MNKIAAIALGPSPDKVLQQPCSLQKFVKIAKGLATEGKHIERPVIPGTQVEDPRNVDIERELAKSSEDEASEDEVSKEEVSEEEASEEEASEEEEEAMRKSPRIPKSKKIATPRSATRDETPQVLIEPVPTPVVHGKYQSFSLTSRKRRHHFVFRYLVHSFVTVQDVQLDWVSNRKLKISIAWPEFWICPEQQSTFDISPTGFPAFPVHHELIGDIMETNEAKRDATDNRIWDLGHLYFKF